VPVVVTVKFPAVPWAKEVELALEMVGDPWIVKLKV
jgi:hypothetical protein